MDHDNSNDVKTADDSQISIEEQSKTEINNLSDDDLIKILSLLSITKRMSLSCVCKRWNNIVAKSLKSEKYLNTFTILGNHYEFITHEGMCKIIEKCSNAKFLHFGGISYGFDTFGDESSETSDMKNAKVFRSIAEHCHQLQTIHFGHIQINRELLLIAQNCLQLNTFVSHNIEDAEFESLITNSVNLKHIDVSQNNEFTGRSLSLFRENIRELFIDRCPMVSQIAIKDLCSGNGRMLTTLSVDIRNYQSLSQICNSLINLNTFKFTVYCDNCDFTDLKKLKQLKSLTLFVDNEMTFKKEDFVTIVQSVNCLTELLIFLRQMNNAAITNDSLYALRKHKQTLEKLVIRGSNAITNEGMYDISQLTKLQYLELMNCEYVSDGIEIVITSCPSLRYLNLHNCLQVSIVTVDAMIEKVKSDPNPQNEYTLDVIGTIVDEPDRVFPENFKCLWEHDDCKYDCTHGGAQNYEFGYESDPDFYGHHELWFDDIDPYDVDFDDDDDYDEDEDYFDDV